MPYLKSDVENGTTGEQQTCSSNNPFEKLVEDLSAALGPSSGLDSEDVDPRDIESLMEKYVSNEIEWGVYAMGDRSRSYTRNLVDEGNGKSNLVYTSLLLFLFCVTF
jgi:cysteine dioxygenase